MNILISMSELLFIVASILSAVVRFCPGFQNPRRDDCNRNLVHFFRSSDSLLVYGQMKHLRARKSEQRKLVALAFFSHLTLSRTCLASPSLFHSSILFFSGYLSFTCPLSLRRFLCCPHRISFPISFLY